MAKNRESLDATVLGILEVLSKVAEYCDKLPHKGFGVSGVMDCPRCKGKNTLRWSRARSNGHYRIYCSTKSCVNLIQ